MKGGRRLLVTRPVAALFRFMLTLNVVLTLLGGALGCAGVAPAPSKHQVQAPSELKPQETHSDVVVNPLDRVGPPEGDCDSNEIPDSLDIANHYADDLDHDGSIDTCEPTYVPGSYDNRAAGWEVAAARGDTLLLLRSFGERVGIALQCYVPQGAGTARLLVRERSGAEVATISNCLEPGAHQLFWALRRSNGLLAERGVEYVICLEQGRRSVRKVVCWRRTVHF